MKKRVKVGDDFDLDARVIEAKVSANESATRSRLAYGAAGGTALALAISTAVGVYDGSFDELQSVWNAAGPLVGAVTSHYFGGAYGRKKK